MCSRGVRQFLGAYPFSHDPYPQQSTIHKTDSEKWKTGGWKNSFCRSWITRHMRKPRTVGSDRPTNCARAFVDGGEKILRKTLIDKLKRSLMPKTGWDKKWGSEDQPWSIIMTHGYNRSEIFFLNSPSSNPRLCFPAGATYATLTPRNLTITIP